MAASTSLAFHQQRVKLADQEPGPGVEGLVAQQVVLQEGDGPGDDLPRAPVIVEDVEAVASRRMVHQLEGGAESQRLVQEGLEAAVETDPVQAGTPDQHRRHPSELLVQVAGGQVLGDAGLRDPQASRQGGFVLVERRVVGDQAANVRQWLAQGDAQVRSTA